MTHTLLFPSQRLRRLVVVAILLVVLIAACIAFAAWWCHGSRDGARRVCVGNLSLLRQVKNQWAIENGGGADTSAPKWGDLVGYIKDTTYFYCPSVDASLRDRPLASYSINTMAEDPVCRVGGPTHSLSYIPAQE